jgi:hypothetical protein
MYLGTIHKRFSILDNYSPSFSMSFVCSLACNEIIWFGSSVADLGCLCRIPDPTFFHPGSRIRTVSIPDPRSRIRIKEFKYFNP